MGPWSPLTVEDAAGGDVRHGQTVDERDARRALREGGREQGGEGEPGQDSTPNHFSKTEQKPRDFSVLYIHSNSNCRMSTSSR